MQITVKLRGHRNLRAPNVKLRVNRDCVYDGTVDMDQMFVFDVENLLPTNIFGIEHHGKDDRETTHTADVAVELLSLAFNGISVPDTVLYNKPYYVNWSRYWPGERPDYVKNTLYFGWNGEYRFDFTSDVNGNTINSFGLMKRKHIKIKTAMSFTEMESLLQLTMVWMPLYLILKD